jgi:ATP-dependent protease HslVU (ClpYQ) ATPase subunit
MARAPQALEVIDQVNAAILPEHTAEARRTVREWLRRHELDDTAVDVEVRRRHGTLLVELWVDGRITERDAEGLGVYLAQCVRRSDPWAKGIDISVHDAIGLG